MIKSPRETAFAEQPNYAPWLEELYAYFDLCNARFFGGALPDVYMGLHSLGGKAFGLCARMRPWSIVLDADLIQYCHEPDKFIVARSVLLHELVHLESFFIPGGMAINHSAWFAARANTISRELGYSPVKSQRLAARKRNGWPSCADWPSRSQGEEFDWILRETKKRARRGNAEAMAKSIPKQGEPLYSTSDLEEMGAILLQIDDTTRGACKVARLAELLARVGLKYETNLNKLEMLLPGGEMFKRL